MIKIRMELCCLIGTILFITQVHAETFQFNNNVGKSLREMGESNNTNKIIDYNKQQESAARAAAARESTIVRRYMIRITCYAPKASGSTYVDVLRFSSTASAAQSKGSDALFDYYRTHGTNMDGICRGVYGREASGENWGYFEPSE